MADDPRLEGKCAKCNKPFTLRAEYVSKDRLRYFCQHFGEKEQMSPDMKQAFLDLTARKAT